MDDVDDAVVVDFLVDLDLLLVVASFEELGVAEGIDFLFGELMALLEEGNGHDELAIGVEEVARVIAGGAFYILVAVDEILSQDAAGEPLVKAELLGVFETPGGAEVVSLLVEEFGDEEIDRAFGGDRLARFELLEDVDQSARAGFDVVILLDGREHIVAFAEELGERILFVDAKGLEQSGCGHFPLPVDADVKDAFEVAFELQPGAVPRDDLAVIDVGAALVEGVLEIGARGTDDLGDDDSLRAIDDEGARLGHERKLAHEDLGVFHLAVLEEQAKHDFDLA